MSDPMAPRERVARIIAPDVWALIDHCNLTLQDASLPDVIRQATEERRDELLADAARLETADQIIAALSEG